MNYEQFLRLRYDDYGNLTPKEQKKVKTDSVKELMKLFGISQPSVWAWTRLGIPADRAIEIVKYYKLDPSCLL